MKIIRKEVEPLDVGAEGLRIINWKHFRRKDEKTMKELRSVKDIAAVRDSQAWFISYVAEYEYMRPRGEDDSPFRLNLGYETSLSPGEPHSNCPLPPSLACLYYLPSGREKTHNRLPAANDNGALLYNYPHCLVYRPG